MQGRKEGTRHTYKISGKGWGGRKANTTTCKNIWNWFFISLKDVLYLVHIINPEDAWDPGLCCLWPKSVLHIWKLTVKLHLITELRCESWVPEDIRELYNATVGSQLLDWELSHGWQILVTQPGAYMLDARCPSIAVLVVEKDHSHKGVNTRTYLLHNIPATERMVSIRVRTYSTAQK